MPPSIKQQESNPHTTMQETREFISNLATIIVMFIIILFTVICCSSCTTTRTITVPEWHERTVNHHDSTATHDITYIHDSTTTQQTADGKVITHYITRDRYHDQIRNVIIDRSRIDSVAADAAIRSAILQAQQSADDAYKLKLAQQQLKQAQNQLKEIQDAKMLLVLATRSIFISLFFIFRSMAQPFRRQPPLVFKRSRGIRVIFSFI